MARNRDAGIPREPETVVSMHRINLKGPWEYTWIDGNPGEGEPSGRVRMPVDWRTVHGDVAGTVLWTRRFNRPTNLEPEDRVFLAFAGIGGSARISLDDVPLGQSIDTTGARFEITDDLERSHELRVELTFDPATTDGRGGLYGVVTLEIASGGG